MPKGGLSRPPMMMTLTTALTPWSIRNWGVAKALLPADVGRHHRLACPEGIAFRRTPVRPHLDDADHARLPADPRPHPKGDAVLTKFHDLGEIGAERLADQAAGFGQDFVQILGLESEFTEPCQCRLLPKQFLLLCCVPGTQGNASLPLFPQGTRLEGRALPLRLPSGRPVLPVGP